MEFSGVDSFNAGNEVEVGVCRNDLFYPMVQHGGGVDGIARGNGGVVF